MDKIDGMRFIFFVSSYRFEAVTKKINNITVFVNMNYGAPTTIFACRRAWRLPSRICPSSFKKSSAGFWS
jgi:hypothetical protein